MLFYTKNSCYLRTFITRQVRKSHFGGPGSHALLGKAHLETAEEILARRSRRQVDGLGKVWHGERV